MEIATLDVKCEMRDIGKVSERTRNPFTNLLNQTFTEFRLFFGSWVHGRWSEISVGEKCLLRYFNYIYDAGRRQSMFVQHIGEESVTKDERSWPLLHDTLTCPKMEMKPRYTTQQC